jgi:type IV secretory pathway TrbF-like protein
MTQSPPPPSNTFRAAGRIYADFLEADQKSRVLFYWISVLLFLCLLAALFTIGYLYKERRETLSVIEVDARTGEIVTKYTPTEYTPSDLQKSYIAKHWIKNVRRIPADPFILREGLLWAYAHTTDKAQTRLDTIFRKKAPVVTENLRTVTDVSSLKKSADSFQVQWQETEYNQNGDKLRSSSQEALLTLTQNQSKPGNAENPTGLFVVFFDWTVGEQ